MANQKPYWFIQAWGYMMHSKDGYVANEIQKAQEEDAPDDSIFRGVSSWATIDDIVREDVKRNIRDTADLLKRKVEQNAEKK